MPIRRRRRPGCAPRRGDPVRRVLQLLGTSALRSRLGIAVVLVVIIFGIVGVARIVSGPDDSPPGAFLPADTSSPVATVNPTAGDDGVAEPEAESTTVADPGPSLRPDAAAADVVAKAFADAWLNRTADAKAWYAALLPNATSDLAVKLKDVDPIVVPAERLTGSPTVVPRGSGFVEVSYPVDSGTLRLRLIVEQGRWLVDGVDWERA